MINLTVFIKKKVDNLIEGALNKIDHLQTALKTNGDQTDNANRLKTPTERKRENLRKKFEVKEAPLENIEAARQKSMLASQGVADHSGSSVHGAGQNLDGKSNSSMWQRNFNNHQGN